MLLVFDRFQDIDIPQLMSIYRKSFDSPDRYDPSNGEADWYGSMSAEDLCEYLRDSMREQTLLCAVWAPEGLYKSVLRLERYLDGYLVTGLETAMQERGHGHAKALLRAVITEFTGESIYSHIDFSNVISIHVHIQCGFEQILDYAKFIDGSISRQAGTFHINA